MFCGFLLFQLYTIHLLIVILYILHKKFSTTCRSDSRFLRGKLDLYCLLVTLKRLLVKTNDRAQLIARRPMHFMITLKCSRPPDYWQTVTVLFKVTKGKSFIQFFRWYVTVCEEYVCISLFGHSLFLNCLFFIKVLLMLMSFQSMSAAMLDACVFV